MEIAARAAAEALGKKTPQGGEGSDVEGGTPGQPNKEQSSQGTTPTPEAGQDLGAEAAITISKEETDAAKALAEEMGAVPLANVRGVGSSQENRCTPAEMKAIAFAIAALHGIATQTAYVGLSEVVRRGGGNTSTPATFKVRVKCPQENREVDISKGDLMKAVERHAQGKTIRNFAEGLALSTVLFGLNAVKAGQDLPGDLAKKIENRLAFEKKPPLSKSERVGCASYAQWLPDLDSLVGSDRVKSLLAQDLELRKQGRFKTSRSESPTKAPEPKGDKAKEPTKGGKNPPKKEKGKK